MFTYNSNSHYVNGALNSRTKEFFHFILTSYEDGIADLRAFLEEALLKPKDMFEVLTDFGFVNKNFFQWLYYQKISNIYEFNTVVRIETKLYDPPDRDWETCLLA